MTRLAMLGERIYRIDTNEPIHYSEDGGRTWHVMPASDETIADWVSSIQAGAKAHSHCLLEDRV